MALSKKQKYGIAFGVFAIGVLLVAIFWDTWFPKKEVSDAKCPNGKPVPATGNCASVMTQQEITNYNNAPKPKPTKNNPTGCINPLNYTPESFPLSFGMFGVNTKKLQEYVGAVPDNSPYGFFGCNTLGQVKKVLNMDSVDQATFDQTQIVQGG